MGHRFSKSAANSVATTAIREESAFNPTLSNNSQQQQQQSHRTFATATTRTIPIPNGASNFVGPTINLQIQESPTATATTTCYNNTTSTKTTASSSSSSTAVAFANNIIQHQSPIAPGAGGISNCSSLTSVNNLSCGRQIIIKIQLAKMENGNETQQQHDSSLENVTADCNLISSELLSTTATATTATNGGAAAQILNLTLKSNASSDNGSVSGSISSSSSCHNMTSTQSALTTTACRRRTAGSSPSSSTPSTLATNNNYLNPSGNSTNFAASMDAPTAALTERLGRLNTLQFHDGINQNIGEIVEYCEVLQEQQQQLPVPPLPPPISSNNGLNNVLTITEEPEAEPSACCRRKSKSLAANGGANSANAKRRCRKCSCRDAFRRILDPSLSRSSNKANKLERKEQNNKQSKAQERHSISNPLNTNRNMNPITQLMPQRNSIHSTVVVPTPSGVTAAAMMAAAAAATSSSASSAATATSANQLAMWAPVTATTTANGSDVIIPLTTPPQFVVVQCAIVNPPLTSTANATSMVSTVAHNGGGLLPAPNSIISITHNPSTTSASNNENIMVKVPATLNTNTSVQTLAGSSSPPMNAAIMGPIVHSQVDFVHYLVPDLERITNSSFYWGKMDRYEAERLLEGKPEGTFLLRDSAQEEFLFSVTFRKYGRSLHARIEQSGHQFSFDCHDPCVFTAPTVTGLLEHYKDPACVMFFEPMLTIPLHRKSCFTLQKLCRATIVSNTTYDGINELELPTRLKSYLKEYHYKQKLRVKSNEPTYTIHCK